MEGCRIVKPLQDNDLRPTRDTRKEWRAPYRVRDLVSRLIEGTVQTCRTEIGQSECRVWVTRAKTCPGGGVYGEVGGRVKGYPPTPGPRTTPQTRPSRRPTPALFPVFHEKRPRIAPFFAEIETKRTRKQGKVSRFPGSDTQKTPKTSNISSLGLNLTLYRECLCAFRRYLLGTINGGSHGTTDQGRKRRLRHAKRGS